MTHARTRFLTLSLGLALLVAPAAHAQTALSAGSVGGEPYDSNWAARAKETMW